MSDLETLPTLVSLAKRKPVESPLCCPTCRGTITLAAGRLWRSTTERHGTVEGEGSSWFGRLAELVVGGPNV